MAEKAAATNAENARGWKLTKEQHSCDRQDDCNDWIHNPIQKDWKGLQITFELKGLGKLPIIVQTFSLAVILRS